VFVAAGEVITGILSTGLIVNTEFIDFILFVDAESVTEDVTVSEHDVVNKLFAVKTTILEPSAESVFEYALNEPHKELDNEYDIEKLGVPPFTVVVSGNTWLASSVLLVGEIETDNVGLTIMFAEYTEFVVSGVLAASVTITLATKLPTEVAVQTNEFDDVTLDVIIFDGLLYCDIMKL